MRLRCIKKAIALMVYCLVGSLMAETTLEFQTGDVNGYNGCEDLTIAENSPDSNLSGGSGSEVAVDFYGGAGHTHLQGLIKFSEIFGESVNQIPLGANITEAKIEVYSLNPGHGPRLHLALADWDESVTWNSPMLNNFGNNTPGIQADNVESSVLFLESPSWISTGYYSFDITSYVQDWSRGRPNYGIVLLPKGNNAYAFQTSEQDNLDWRPKLIVSYSLESDSPKSPNISLSQNKVLSLSGIKHQRYRVYHSLSLEADSWNQIYEVTMNSATSAVPISATLANSKGFYRASSLNFLADSDRDWSSRQGHRGWRYGYKESPTVANYLFTPFKEMTFGTGLNSQVGWPGSGYYVSATDFFTAINRRSLHPSGTEVSSSRLQVEHWPIRRWTSPINATLRITVNLHDSDLADHALNNGVICRIFKDNEQLESVVIDRGGGAEITFQTSAVIGTVFDFAIDPKDGIHIHDSTSQQIFIEAIN